MLKVKNLFVRESGNGQVLDFFISPCDAEFAKRLFTPKTVFAVEGEYNHIVWIVEALHSSRAKVLHCNRDGTRHPSNLKPEFSLELAEIIFPIL